MSMPRSPGLIHCARLALGLGVLGCPVAAAAQTTVVYNSITANPPDIQPVQNVIDEIGDDVTLAPGTPRNISSFSLRIFNDTDLEYSGTFTARFYTYSGGLPQTLLWEGQITVSDGEPSADRILTWDVPNVTVPDQFAWSFSHNISFPVTAERPFGLAINGAQTVGSSNDEVGYYRDVDGFWPTPFRYRDITDPDTGQPFDLDTSWEARIVAGTPLPPPEWNVDGSGSWATASNWVGNTVPDGPGAEAAFLGRVTSPAGATVTLDRDRTVGRLVFDNVNPYRITSGSVPGANLILDGGDLGLAEVQVNSGQHTISTGVIPMGDTDITVAQGAELTLQQSLTVPAGRVLRKSGGGTLHLTVLNPFVEAGGNLQVTSGRLETQLGILAEEAFVDVGSNATIAIKPSGSSDATSVLFALSIAGEPDAPEGTFDLANNAMILKISTDEELRQWIRAARADGTWTGKGLTSSAARDDADGITTIGYALNNNGNDEQIGPLYEFFGGRPAELNDFLVRYTYAGDANLDGKVDIQDYFLIDVGSAARETGWINGDFDHSGGPPDAADYMLIDRAFLAQGEPLSLGIGPALAAARAASPVPEPSALMALLAAPALLLRRRQGHAV